MSTDHPQEPHPDWLIDELKVAGRENLDVGHVARYDDKEDASASEEVELLREMGLNGGSIVLELGAGTGQLTAAVASACARVIAVDVSPPMLKKIRTKVAERGLDNVEIVRGGFLTYEHVGESPNFIYSRYALHHLPDFWKALALNRLRELLRPGGILRLWDVVYDFSPAEAEKKIEQWCATGGDDIDADWTRSELEEHIRDEHSTFIWLLEPMIVRSGFEIVSSERSEDGIFAKYVLRAA